MSEWTRFRRWRERHSHGPASPCRYLDPRSYQPSPADPGIKPDGIRAQNKTLALLDAADGVLIADAGRHGKRHAKRVRNKIVTGRY